MLNDEDDIQKEDDIKQIFDQCSLINLLEDYRFTYQELKDVLWENPEEQCMKLFYKQIKHEPREQLVQYDVFKQYFRDVESQMN